MSSAASCREFASQFRTLALGWRTCCEPTLATLCEERASLYEAEAERLEAGSRP
jgi:hypothetical protein